MDPLRLLAKFTQKIQNLNKSQTQIISQTKNNPSLNDQPACFQVSQNNDKPVNSMLQEKNDPKVDQIDLISEEKKQQKHIQIQQQEDQQQLENEQDRDIMIPQEKKEQNQQEFEAIVDQNLKKSNIVSKNEDLLKLIKMKIQKDAKNLSENPNFNNQTHNKPSAHENINKVCKSLPPVNITNSNSNNNGNQNQGDDKTSSLTDGRQYDEPFRRKFVKKLMKSLSTENPEKINDLLRNAAHTIQVHLYQVKIWLTSYKLIFNIERYISQKQGSISQNQKLNLIKKELLSFLQKNKNQKKYRIIKILNYLFQTFGFADIKTHAWMNQFTTQFHKELKGMDIAQSRSSKTKSNDEQSSDQQRKQDKGSKKNSKIEKKSQHNRKQMDDQSNQQQSNQLFEVIPEKKKNKNNNKKETVISHSTTNSKKIDKSVNNIVQESILTPSSNQDISMYPLAFKKKMSQRINHQIGKSIEDIIKSKSEEFCLSFNTIKCIYQENGQYILKRKVEQNEMNSINKKDRLKKANNENNLPQNSNNSNQKGLISQKSFNSTQNAYQNKTLSNKPNPIINKGPQTVQNIPGGNMGGKIIQNNVPQNIQNQNLLQKLQMRLLGFLRANSNCYISVVQKQTQSHMEQNKFSEKLKNQVRNQWFCHFLRKNKYSIAPDRRVIKYTSQIKHDLPGNQRTIQGPPINRPPSSGQVNQNTMNMKQNKSSYDPNRNYYMN